MSNPANPNNNNNPSPDFYSFRFPARPANNDVPHETTFYSPSSRYAVGTFQTIYGSFNSRMRRVSDFEPVKHKRSRKGCYTCRARRVKCDEVRPACQRCRKGKRACVFPEPPSTPGEESAKSSPDARQSSAAPSSSRDAASADKSPEDSSDRGQQGSSTTSSDVDRALSHSRSLSSKLRDEGSAFTIRPEARFYLDYFNSHLSDHALRDDALMFAIVAFAAYLAMIADAKISMDEFLGFYSSSMFMLRTSLRSSSGQRLSVTTLMTVLQLALLEESLGDWVNLQAHKKAALRLITEMYTPTAMLGDELTTILLEWYMRFDQFTAFMSNNQSGLGKEWFHTSASFLSHNVKQDSDDPTVLRLRAEMSQRVLSKDVSLFFTATEPSSTDENARKAMIQSLTARFEQWRNEFEPLLFQQAELQAYLTEHASSSASTTPYDTDSDSHYNIWPAKNLLVRSWATEIFFLKASSVMLGQQPTQDLAAYARRLCSMLEDIGSNEPHPDAILGIRAPLAMMAIICKNDPEWAPWCQNGLSAIESRGFLYPSAFRRLMQQGRSRGRSADTASAQHEEETDDDGDDVAAAAAAASDDLPPIIHAVREWVEERSTNQLDRQSENIRAIAGIIGALDPRDA